jgi:ribosome-binding factor A
MSHRAQRVAEEIRKVISERLVRGLRTPLPGFVTISHVEINADLAEAKVFYSVFGTEEQATEVTKALGREKGALRYEVGQKIRLRMVPELIFIRDKTPEQAMRIEELLKRN